jgi:aspartate aminotransferase
MYRFSDRVNNMVPSVTGELTSKVDELRRSGVDIVNLSIGEPDFDTPAHIIASCKEALDKGYTHYTPVPGIMQLREAVCSKLQRENNVTYSPAEIVVSTGAKQALNNVMLALINPGDEVVTPTPCWVSYFEIIKLAGGVPVPVACLEEEDFQLNVERVREAITPKTRAILINTPNNPTGAVYNPESMRALGELAVEKGIVVISDEIYEKLVFGSAKHVCLSSLSKEIWEHTVLINGLSKSCAMTGWRLGYSAAPAAISRAVNSIQGHLTSNSTTFVQWASVDALNNSDKDIENMVEEFGKRREYVYKRLTSIPGIKCAQAEGAFYLMPNVSYFFGRSFNGTLIKDDRDFCKYILDKAHVALAPGSAFEAPENIRLAYATSMQNLEKGLDWIEKALSQLS